MSDSLINKGIAVIGDVQSESPPIVVVGVARGGTSMIAGSMAHLGIFMGNKSSPPVFEDVQLSKLFEDRDFVGVKKLVNQYNERYGLWGWKRPSSINYLDEVHFLLNSPRYIFVYKDIMSIAQRNAISMLSELISGMQSPIDGYKKTLDFILKNKPRAMLVSYEKVMSDPFNFLKELKNFSGINPSEVNFNSAIEFISPNPENYLDNSRITKAQGRLGGVKGNQIYGWARLVHANHSARVDLFVNDKKIGTIVADRPRPDLLEKFNQNCAFFFDLNLNLKSGDLLRARVVNEVVDLENSPLLID